MRLGERRELKSRLDLTKSTRTYRQWRVTRGWNWVGGCRPSGLDFCSRIRPQQQEQAHQVPASTDTPSSLLCGTWVHRRNVPPERKDRWGALASQWRLALPQACPSKSVESPILVGRPRLNPVEIAPNGRRNAPGNGLRLIGYSPRPITIHDGRFDLAASRYECFM